MAGHPVFAAIYDRLLAASEKAGLREMRSGLLAGAAGRTLEIGSGTGLNLDLYPEAVTELVLTEPDPHMAKRLAAKLEAGAPHVGSTRVVAAGAEELPFEDADFDTVVSTLVLCTTPDPDAAVAEVRRVLRPGGRFLFLEHVRDRDGTRRARWQDRLEKPWGVFAGACHPNRDTGRLLAGGFEQVDASAGEFPGAGTALVRPLITGTATR